MKRCRLAAAALMGLALVLLVAACAYAAEVRPVEAAPGPDLSNGTFCLTVRDKDRIENSGFFTAALFLEDLYDADQIRALVPGDTILVNGEIWTVDELVLHETEEGEFDSYEIYTREEYDGYIAFRPSMHEGLFLCVTNDWSPVTPAGEVKVMLPLPDRFEYIYISAGEEEEPRDMQAFLDSLAAHGEFTAWNTSCVFENGELVRVVHSSYPEGPEDGGE